MISQVRLATVCLVAFDFDGVFTDNTVYVSQDGLESVRCWRGDGIGLQRLRDVGVKCVIISTETNPVVEARAKKLKIPCMHGVEDKARALLEVCKDFNIAPDQAMFVGNDVNDIPAFGVAGIPVAVADASEEVIPFVEFRTSRPGGHGAVREVCDLLFDARGRGEEDRK